MAMHFRFGSETTSAVWVALMISRGTGEPFSATREECQGGVK